MQGRHHLNSRQFGKHKRLCVKKKRERNYELRKYTIFHNKCPENNSKRFTGKVDLRISTVKNQEI